MRPSVSLASLFYVLLLNARLTRNIRMPHRPRDNRWAKDAFVIVSHYCIIGGRVLPIERAQENEFL